MPPRKVLITGIYGLIPGAVYDLLKHKTDKYLFYGLARRAEPSARSPKGRVIDIPKERFHLCDISDWAGVRKAVEGMDVVVHMAADPRGDAPWESVLPNNIIGTYNVFEASKQAGVKRIVYASTIMTTWGYALFEEPYKSIFQGNFQNVPKDFPKVSHLSPVRPTGLYPASKVWGEAMARYYSDVHGLSVICLRIGGVNADDRPSRPGSSGGWCSQRDIVQLVERCIDAPDSLRFDIFYGVSNNKWRWVDIEHPRKVVGYVPQDSAENYL